MQHSTIELPGERWLTSFWHCFGTERHRASEDVVLGLLAASGTNVLPINTHLLDASRDRLALEHGFGGVAYDTVASRIDVSSYVKMLNINLRTSAKAAVEVAKIAYEMTGEPVFKLEVLTEDLRGSQDMEVVKAAEALMAWNDELVILPLLTNSVVAADAAQSVGCPLLRIMGSKISSGQGIANIDDFNEICSRGLPVVLDGGIGAVEDLTMARKLGARGALVNSVLFDDGRPPVTVMHEYAAAAVEAFA